MHTNYSERLKILRERNGLPLSQWSEKSGVPTNTINNIIYGRSRPSLDDTVALLKALDLPLSALECDITNVVQTPTEFVQTPTEPVQMPAKTDIAYALEIQAKEHEKAYDLLKNSYKERLDEQKEEIRHLRKVNTILTVCLTVITVAFVGQWVYDFLDRSVGFIRGHYTNISQLFGLKS